MYDVAGRIVLRRAAAVDFDLLRQLEIEADLQVGSRLGGRIPPPSLHRNLLWNDAVHDMYVAFAARSRAPLGYVGSYDHSIRSSTVWLNVVGGRASIGTGAMALVVAAYLDLSFRNQPIRAVLAEMSEPSRVRLGSMVDAAGAETLGVIPAVDGRSRTWIRIRREAYETSAAAGIAPHIRPIG